MTDYSELVQIFKAFESCEVYIATLNGEEF